MSKYPYLKEKISEHLLRNPDAFDMRHLMVPLSWRLSVYNFAGLILKHAGYSLQLSGNGIRLPLNAPLLDKRWIEFEEETGFCRNQDEVEIMACARQVWEDEYGEEEAKALPFYEEVKAKGCMWWDDLSEVRANNLRMFLRGDKDDMPYNVNGPWEGDDD
jgi:hypothetical protein